MAVSVSSKDPLTTIPTLFYVWYIIFGMEASELR